MTVDMEEAEEREKGGPGQAQVLGLIPWTGVAKYTWKTFLFSNFITYIFILTC